MKQRNVDTRCPIGKAFIGIEILEVFVIVLPMCKAIADLWFCLDSK